jgi:hypothetical protein
MTTRTCHYVWTPRVVNEFKGDRLSCAYLGGVGVLSVLQSHVPG